MKQFLKFLFASMFGTIIAFFVCIALCFAIVGIIISSASKDDEHEVKENSVLVLNFEEEVTDRASNNPLENFDFSTFESSSKLGLNEILENLEKASQDDHIKGVFLDISLVQMGMSQVNEIRKAMQQVKDSGKFVVAYGEVYTLMAYYLASCADKVYMHPQGMMEFAGLSSNRMFFKGTLEKLEIDMQVIRHGKFKSAVEPFSRTNMSEENRIQTRSFLGSLWDNMATEIGKSRKIEIAELNRLADDLIINNTEAAVEARLIDAGLFRDQVMDELKTLAGTAEDDDVALVEYNTYRSAKVNKEEKKELEDYKTKIAVVYASGEIQSGESEDGTMGSETIAKAIKEAREDEKVKAVVLRVNSPGGSSLASDVIWREVVLTKAEKPVVVSMGDLAASGGYYISCAANYIVADGNTITGSIGVFGMVPNAQGFFNNKLGITFDTVNTNKNADLFAMNRPLKEIEYKFIENLIEEIYDDFITRVSEGRNMTKAQVDSIGQGRVWSGSEALAIGLVDELGGMNRAIEKAAELAELENYRILELPKQKDPFEEMFSSFSENVESKMAKSYMGEHYAEFNQFFQAVHQKGIFMRLPFDFMIE